MECEFNECYNKGAKANTLPKLVDKYKKRVTNGYWRLGYLLVYNWVYKPKLWQE